MTVSESSGPVGGPAPSALVVALGSPDRGDDAVGAAVARRVRSLLPGVRVVDHEDPATLIETWTGHDPVVVVDAVRSGAVPGSVLRLAAGAAAAPLPESAWSGTGRGGTHAIGLATAVELARVLHRLPETLVLVGVEGTCFDHGAALSPAVAASVDEAARTVLAELVESTDPSGPAGGSGHVPG